MGDFMAFVGRTRGLEFADYDELWQWSVNDLAGFWSAVWDYFEVIAHTPHDRGADSPGDAGRALVPRRHAQLRRARAADARARRRRPGRAGLLADPAADHADRRPSCASRSAGSRAGLRRLGVGAGRPGRRVRAEHPRDVRADAGHGEPRRDLLLLRARVRHPRRWSTGGSQIEPTVLLAVDGYRYGDKPVDRRDRGGRRSGPRCRRCATPCCCRYLDPAATAAGRAALGRAGRADRRAARRSTPVPFDHPLYVLYSSGTTGLPKPIVHGHGGILLEHLKNAGAAAATSARATGSSGSAPPAG